ncbi:lambda exonuclease family protein [Achromobacter denitrificans]|uniref:Lambda exonuclease family protein n=1 Tax=Achromobacter denitrificans TaxID=32002 RepID=A0ABZ3GCK2_ACHDE
MSESIEQRTEAWLKARSGKITASRFADVIAVSAKTGKPLQAREDYMLTLAAERTSGIPKQSITSKSLSWGTDLEEHAREAYEIEKGQIVEETGFVLHPVHAFIGASSDGWIGDDGLIEIKCPHDEKVHVRTWLYGMPADHMAQIQGNLLVTGRQWADFISYDPRAGEPWRLYVQRIPRDEAYIKTLLTALLQFEAELRAMVDTLRRKAA